MTNAASLSLNNASLKDPGKVAEKPKVDASTDLKAKDVFDKTKEKFEAENSDDELSLDGSTSSISVLSKKKNIKVEAMTIACTDESGKVKNIKGSTLIEIVHDVTQDFYEGALGMATEYEKEIDGTVIDPPEVTKEGVIIIRQPKDWVLSLGGWKGMAPSEEIREFFFYSKKDQKFTGASIYKNGMIFPLTGHRVHIKKGFVIKEFDVTKAWGKGDNNKWVEIPGGRTDLSYPQIIQAIKYIKKTFNLTDSAIANIQLSGLSRSLELPEGIWKEVSKNNQEEILVFLDYLNALMFGIEASGLNAAMLTGLMTLDLIVDGKFNYETAFKANEDGGVYPYACFGNNQGTYNERERILLHAKEKRESLSMKQFRETPSLSPVASKEAIMTKHWLESNDVIDSKLTYIDQTKRIKLALIDLTYHYFSPWMKTSIVKKFAKTTTDEKKK